MWWVLGVGLVAVGGILYDTWRYRRNTELVIDLLDKCGPLTGLEISQAGVSRSHTYLILARLQHRGVVVASPAKNPKYGGQFQYTLVK